MYIRGCLKGIRRWKGKLENYYIRWIVIWKIPGREVELKAIILLKKPKWSARKTRALIRKHKIIERRLKKITKGIIVEIERKWFSERKVWKIKN